MTSRWTEARLSPSRTWLAALIHESEDGSDSARQSLVVHRLGDDAPPRILRTVTAVAPEFGEDLDAWLDYNPVILDDGTTFSGSWGFRTLVQWQPDGTSNERPLFDSWHTGELHVRPDNGALLVVHARYPGVSDEGWNASVIDLATGDVAPWRDFAAFRVVGWSRDLETVFAMELTQSTQWDLVASNLKTRTQDMLVTDTWCQRSAASPAWIVWSSVHEIPRGFWRIPTTGGKPTLMPALAAWLPLAAIDDDHFLCATVDDTRHAIVDVRQDLGARIEVELPPVEIDFAPSLDAFVSWSEGRYELWRRDGTLIRTVNLLA